MKTIIKISMFLCLFAALHLHSIMFMILGLGFYLMNEQVNKEKKEHEAITKYFMQKIENEDQK